MAHHATNMWLECPDQFGSFDTFQAKAEVWLAGKGVDPTIQYNKIVLMLDDLGLKKWKKFKLSEEGRKDPVKVFKKFRESLGNDISFYTTRSTLYRNYQQGTN